MFSIAHGFFKNNTSELVTDSDDAQREIRRRKRFQFHDDPPQKSSKKVTGKVKENL